MSIESTNIQLPINPPLLISDVSNTSWDIWLIETEKKLKELGYIRYVQNHKNEDFCYWKIFKNGEKKTYQIGIFFYDFRKYSTPDLLISTNRIGITYECMLLGENRIDMCVGKDIELKEFELMSVVFYKAMLQYCH